MPENEIIRRRSALLLDVTQAASEVSKTRHTGHDRVRLGLYDHHLVEGAADKLKTLVQVYE
jgi:hypothetical protein